MKKNTTEQVITSKGGVPINKAAQFGQPQKIGIEVHTNGRKKGAK